ncbi:HAD family hydrolase [Methylobacterium sp. Leaf106]|uniref:HAD family hydrolase n=1 Tax=Methylobacterium sp. Leaf106 TaxID=1736255 RepID=UPI0009EC9D28|nr:HAD family phosphatase [Methylobacterium sp. Leaf106]
MPFPQAIAAVIFDMDGLLFDTERLYFEAMRMAADELGTSLTPEIIYHTIGLPVANCNVIWAEHFGPNFEAASFWAVTSRNFKMLAENDLRLKAGAIELLDLLDRLKLPRAIATSTDRMTVDHHLAKVGLSERFDAIVAYGDYDHGKPHPAPYTTAAERLGVAPMHCLALEDSHNGVRSAAAAGMTTIMVPDLIGATEEMRELTLRVARDLHEVYVLFDLRSKKRQISATLAAGGRC